jgi:hypothetical protein
MRAYMLLLAGCSALWGQARQSMPDPRLTPGHAMAASKEQVCTPGWAGAHRDVSIAIKKFVYRVYRVQYSPGWYEVDHLISLQLGGSNDVDNLWPEPYDDEWGAYVKDALETRAHRLVCTGKISLADAQHRIATDWISFYRDVFHTRDPLPRHLRRRTSNG